MSFREKTLWVSMLAVAGIWGAYLFDIGTLLARGTVDAEQAYGGFVRSVVLLVLVEIVAVIVLAVVAPADADAPIDARDRDFAASAAVHAYNLLSACVVIVMLATPVALRLAPRYLTGDPATVNAVVIGNALLLSLALAHLLHCGWQITRYRREG